MNRYRQFEQFELAGLRQVNLLVGRNNSGKTSLLEAIQIATSRPTAPAIVDIALRRGEVEREDDRLRESTGPSAAIRHMWRGHTFGPKPTLGPGFTTYGAVQGEKHEIGLSIEPPQALAADNPSSVFSNRLGSLQIYRDGERQGYPLSPAGLLSPAEAEVSVWDDVLQAPVFLSTLGFSRARLTELYDQAVKRKLEKKAVSALQILAPVVKEVFFLASGKVRDLLPGEGILLDTGDGERQPLGSMGDGMKAMLALGLALANAERGILLVDEIDTGLHYSVMRDMWRMVVQTSLELNVQVFATTHSLDCIRGLVEMGSEKPGLFEQVAVHKIDSRRNQSALFAGDDLEAAVETGLELR